MPQAELGDGQFTVAPMTPDDLNVLVELHGKYLNYGDGVRPHYDAVLRDPASAATKCLCGDVMVGFDIYTKGISLSGEHPELMAELERRTAGACVYTGDALLVREEYRGKGVTELLRAASKQALLERGVSRLIHELWVYPDGHVPAKKVVRAYSQAEFVGRFPMFYRDFHHFGYFCPICGGVCSCSADIYITHVP